MLSPSLFTLILFFLFFSFSYQCETQYECEEEDICIEGVCGPCEKDSQCSLEQVCISGECHHENLFPLDYWDIILIIIMTIGALLNSSVGVGGGTFYISVLLLLFFPTREAIPISNAMSSGSAMAQVLLNIRERHPKANRPLIDFDVSSIVAPLSVSGTIIGGLIYRALPEIIVKYLFIAFLGILNLRISKKAYHQWKDRNISEKIDPEESEKMGLIQEEEEEEDSELTESEESLYSSSETASLLSNKTTLSQLLEEESRFPFKKLSFILILFTFVAAFGWFFKQSQLWTKVKYCSVLYWFLLFSIFPVLIFLSVMIGHSYIKRDRSRVALGYTFQVGDVRWTRLKVLSLVILSLSAGIASAMFGIGGGFIYVTAMIELGLIAEVYPATSSFLSLLTSLSSLVQHSFSGYVLVDYVLMLSLLTFVSAIVGVKVIRGTIKKSGKSYLIMIFLSFAMVSSIVAVFAYTLSETLDTVRGGSTTWLSPNSVC